MLGGQLSCTVKPSYSLRSFGGDSVLVFEGQWTHSELGSVRLNVEPNLFISYSELPVDGSRESLPCERKLDRLSPVPPGGSRPLTN